MISKGAINTLFRRPPNNPLSSYQLTLPSLAAYARYYYKRKPQLAIMVTAVDHRQAPCSRPSVLRNISIIVIINTRTTASTTTTAEDQATAVATVQPTSATSATSQPDSTDFISASFIFFVSRID